MFYQWCDLLIKREVKAQEFADAMRSMTCSPDLSVWIREPLALHINNATPVPGRTGFANFSASLAMLP
eukprot:1149208-Pelagomonas_calceolata.AAC.1